MKSKGFTLIELLIVIAIIGILASMLLPSLQQARVKTIAAVCLSNQKQIQVATTLYAQDNDDWFVRMRDSQTRAWQNALHDAGLLEVPNSTSMSNNSVLRRHLPDKSYVIWCPAETKHHPIADIGINGNLSWWTSGHSRRAEVIDPVDVVSFSDAHQSGTEFGEWYIHSSNWINESTGISSGGNPFPNEARHGDKTVAVFVDGHGTYLSTQEVIQNRQSLFTGPLDSTNPDYN